MSEIKVIITGDGSHSLYVPHLDETYHSSFGAITESEHIFIKDGLDYFLHTNPGLHRINVFELGFGTGLNALLSYRYALLNHISLNYVSIESDPLPPGFAVKLNYPEHVDFKDSGKVFRTLHDSPWDRKVILTDFFSFEKIHMKVEDYSVQPGNTEVVYYDAFAPGIQPAIWGKEILSGMFDMLREGGVLVTYCAQGQFRRNLKEVGFQVEKLPGPPGKKEIVRALKTNTSFQA